MGLLFHPRQESERTFGPAGPWEHGWFWTLKWIFFSLTVISDSANGGVLIRAKLDQGHFTVSLCLLPVCNYSALNSSENCDSILLNRTSIFLSEKKPKLETNFLAYVLGQATLLCLRFSNISYGSL